MLRFGPPSRKLRIARHTTSDVPPIRRSRVFLDMLYTRMLEQQGKAFANSTNSHTDGNPLTPYHQ